MDRKSEVRHACQTTCLDVRDTVLDISVETHSDHSSTEHSRNISTAASVSRSVSCVINDLTLEYQTSDSASSSKFNHLALLVALVLH